MRLLALSFIFVAMNLLHAADELPKTLLTERGTELFKDDLSKQPAKPAWNIPKGKWELADGVVKAAELKTDSHGAVMRHSLAFKDAVIQFDFKLDGAKSISLSVNDAKEHVCRVVLNAAGFRAQKDDHDHDGPDKAKPFALKAIKLDDGQWHTVVLEILGNTIAATLDGKLTSFGSDDLIATPKANFGFTVAGESAYYRNVKIWEATANKDWDATKAKLEAK